MKTLVIDGHPNPDSLTAALAARYAEACDDARLLVVRDLDFDLRLHGGYGSDQPTEPDIENTIAALFEADHIVIATPVWWGSVPATLKGFFDRAFRIGETYRYSERGFPEGLLAGRSGRLIVTSDSPRWYLALVGDTTVRQVRRTTMKFCGIKPVKLSRFTGVRHASPEQRRTWLDEIAQAAARDGAATKAPATQLEQPAAGASVN